MCALAMMSFATQAQDDVIYEISSTPATELVKDHIYVLQNHAYPAYGLFYNNNNGCASTYQWNEDLLVQCMPYQYFFLTAGADGITLPVTLTNINDNGEMDYGNTGGGTVLSRPSYAPNPDEPVYFTVKDAAGQLAMLTYNVEYCDLYGVIYGGENTTPAECAQWIAYEVTKHEHNWKIVYDEDQSYYHHCTKCDVEERHYVAEEDGKCVCGYQCSEHSYHMDDYASVKATENADGQYIVVKICEYCQHEKTETVDPDGECPEGDNHSWVDDGTINATCTAKGYTYHICKKCEMLYVADFTDINPDNHDWLVEEQWNEEDELVSMHFCCNGCEAYGQDQEHNMVDGKCTVCGYWPGHTEHQWEAYPESHRCTIPGCEEHGESQEHTRGENCVCTVCGYTEHYWYDGECENCGAVCYHENPWYEEARDATCFKNGNKAYYACVCNLFFADADCTKKITWEDICIPATGHQFDEEHHCTVCDRSITIGSTITLGEAANVNFNNYCGRYNEKDPTAEPLYKIELTKAAYNFSISEELDSPSIAIFDKDFNYILTVDVNEPKFLEAGTCYLLPSAYLDEEDEGGIVEFAGIDVPLTITCIESITLETAEVTDEQGNAVEINLTDDGSYATTQNIVLTDGVESFSTPVDFKAPKVDYERLMPNSQWGTLCLPFDITVDAAGKPYDFYELTSATSTEVTLTKVADGILRANTPVIVRRNASETGVHFSEPDVTVKTNRGYSDGEEKDGLQMIGVFMPHELYGGSYYLDAVDGMLYDTGEYYNETGDPVKVNAYRCYFDVVGRHVEARPLNIVFEEEEVSAIEAIDALTSGKAKFYDLQGRERSELQSGLNVLKYGNGKSVKVIIK